MLEGKLEVGAFILKDRPDRCNQIYVPRHGGIFRYRPRPS